MLLFIKRITFLFLLLTFVLSSAIFANDNVRIPILCYHNFNPTIPGSMSMTPKKFEEQLQWLKDNGYTVIPLKEAVAYLQGSRASLPEKPVVITADDGWQSVYTYMFPLVKKYNVPVTLFIYPQAISTGKHAMTWDELKELKQTGLFDIQGHTYWHPNFKQEKRRLSPAAYEKFVNMQLAGSKKVLDEKLDINVTLLAWPFGIYNDYLEQAAKSAGYEMAFTIDDRGAKRSDRAMAEPRFMLLEGQTMKTFEGKVRG